MVLHAAEAADTQGSFQAPKHAWSVSELPLSANRSTAQRGTAPDSFSYQWTICGSATQTHAFTHSPSSLNPSLSKQRETRHQLECHTRSCGAASPNGSCCCACRLLAAQDVAGFLAGAAALPPPPPFLLSFFFQGFSFHSHTATAAGRHRMSVSEPCL